MPNCTFHATKPQRYAKIFNTRDKKCSVSSRGSVDAERFDLFVEGVQDLHLGVQEVVGDVNLVVVRVDQASFGWAEVREDVVVEGFLLRQRVASGADPAVSYDLMLKGSPGIFTGLEDLVLVAVLLVVDREGLAGFDPSGEGVPAKAGDVGATYS